MHNDMKKISQEQLLNKIYGGLRMVKKLRIVYIFKEQQMH
jgi:hypothetical protein